MIELSIFDGQERRTVTCAAILFDMDGTLVDSTACVEKVWREWAVSRGVDPTAVLAVAHGRQNPEVLRLVAPQLNTPEEQALLKSADEACQEGIVAVPGAGALLAALPQDHWAIVTSAWRTLAKARLSLVGLPVPGVMVTADDTVHGKPHPEGYLQAAERLGVDPGRCLVIEDSHAGIAAGQAAGMMVLGITTTFSRAGLRHSWSVDDLHAVTVSR